MCISNDVLFLSGCKSLSFYAHKNVIEQYRLLGNSEKNPGVNVQTIRKDTG